jgi:hypothetical protein
MAGKRKLWNQLGRMLTGAIVLCFFMPFFGVSCEGMDIVTMSGADMVGGCKPGGLIAEMEEQAQDMESETETVGAREMPMNIENVEREPLAIAAMAAAVLLFALAWVRRQQALLAALLLGLAGIGSLVGLYMKVAGDLDDKVELGLQEKAKDVDPDAPKIDRTKDDKIESGARIGFWLTAIGMLGVVVLAGLALFEKPQPEAPPLDLPVT